MVAKSASKPVAAASCCQKQRFKGVRMRSWGKWVSEIRLPNTRARLWLGSYNTAEQAARAFDVAVVCLRGRSSALNFPDSPPSYAPLGLPHHQIQELAAAAAATAPTTASSSAPTPCELTAARPSSDESETATINSDESETATISCWSQSDESATNEMSSCSSTFDDSATFAGLLQLDEEENEQSSPLDAALQEHALNMGSEWDELLWGFSTMTSYSAAWDEHLLLLPPLPAEDDLPIIVEPSLWCL